jgi:hypothetical protein
MEKAALLARGHATNLTLLLFYGGMARHAHATV